MPIIRSLKYVSDAMKFLFGEGSWTLLSHEQRVLEAAIESLEPEAQEAVREQLAVPFFVERMNEGRINVFRFYRPVESLRLRDGDYEDLLIRVRVSVEDRSTMAHVTLHRGRIFSVEFKKPRMFFLGKDLKVVSVTEGSPKDSVTRVIDRAERGRERNNGV